MSRQSDKEGQTTFDPHDKDPYRRKVQLSKPTEPPVKKLDSEQYRIGAVAAKKHVTVFTISARRKNIPLDERRPDDSRSSTPLPNGAIGWVTEGVPLWPKDDEDPQAQKAREWHEQGAVAAKAMGRRRYNEIIRQQMETPPER